MFIREFNDPGCQDVREVGGKAAGLAQMTADGLPVAPGFAVTAAAYRAYLEADGLKEFTRSVLEGLGTGRDQAAFDDAGAPYQRTLHRGAHPGSGGGRSACGLREAVQRNRRRRTSRWPCAPAPRRKIPSAPASPASSKPGSTSSGRTRS